MLPRCLLRLVRSSCVCLLALAGFTTPAIAQTATTSIVYSFQTDLQRPISPIIQASDGHYYGVAISGAVAAEQIGGIYRMTPGAQNPYSLVHAFAQDTSEGVPGQSGLVEGPNGLLYGVTQSGGGSNNNGTFYSVNPLTSAFTVLHAFGSEASSTFGAPVLGSDGNFYIASTYGGSHANGSIVQITPGTATLLYSFAGPEGENPLDSLLETSPGTFYGTAQFGGAHSNGSIFKVVVTSSGGMSAATVTDVYDFNDANDNETAPFTAGPNGNLYTTSDPNGSATYGAILEFNPATAGLTTPFTFTASNAGTYGFYPSAPLFLGSDNNFYTATGQSSFASNGDILRISPTGTATTIFDGSNEQNAELENASTGVIQGSDGNLYLQTPGGGSDSQGDFVQAKFTTALPGPVTLKFASSSVVAGTPVKLTFTAANAYSTTLQQCYAYFQGSGTGGGNWSGLQTGTGGANGVAYSGSVMITPTAPGTYDYALTCGGQESGFANLTVTGGAKKTASVAPSATPNPVAIGQPLTLSATVTSANGHPTGSVTFSGAGVTIGTADLNNNGIATIPNIPTMGEPAGTYSLQAVYSGDASFNSSGAGFNVTLANKNNTVLTATATPSPVLKGQTVLISGSLKTSSGSAIANAFVAVYLGTTSIASAHTNSSGAYSISAAANVPSGPYSLTVKFTGDNANNPSSASLNVDVTQNSTTLLIVTPNPVKAGNDVTLGVDVSETGEDTYATGIPSLYIALDSTSTGSLVFAFPALSHGLVSVTLSSNGYPAGTYYLYAKYPGDSHFLPSTSPRVTFTIQ